MIQTTSIVRQSNGTWQYNWSGSADYYRIVLNGKELARVTNTTYTYFLSSDYPQPIEIVATTDLAVSEMNIPFLRIQWYGDPSVSSYEVQQNMAGVWTTVFSQMEIGVITYTFTTPLLLDLSTYIFRILSYNELQQPSTGISHSISIVRPQEFVETGFEVTYSGGNIIFGVRL